MVLIVKMQAWHQLFRQKKKNLKGYALEIIILKINKSASETIIKG